MFRFNSTTDKFEGYNGASWVILGSTLPTGEATNYGSTTTTAISTHDYGAITDADSILIDYEDSSHQNLGQLWLNLFPTLLFKNNNIIY